MNEKILKCLYDIKFSLEEIDSFFGGKELIYEEYAVNILLKLAIERNLEIIGEAMSRILKEDSVFPLENAKRIVGLRNQIIHGYDNVSDENIWGILINHLPKLKEEVNNLVR
ncbi:MAG: DUF86 domain-containing protein [Bacteroidetes bacterium]|nr:DUF86 domain-containing protein [Bacteroidota bacterium]